MSADIWDGIKKQSSGHIGSLLEFIQGKLSDRVMDIDADKHRGLFPGPRDIHLNCDCPDWAVMCKHVAAVLYGIGNRLDGEPELLFHLRRVDAQELISTGLSIPHEKNVSREEALSDDDLGELFGIDSDQDLIETDREEKKAAARNGKMESSPEGTTATTQQQSGKAGTPQAQGKKT